MFNKTKQINALNSQVLGLQTMVTNLTSAFDSLYRIPNKTCIYNTKAEQVLELRNKYKGIANSGNQLAQRLVNLRVALSVPNRLFIMPNLDSSKSANAVSDIMKKNTKEFLLEFMRVNNLDGSLPRDFAKEAELQGQVVVRLVWSNKHKVPQLKYYPWNEVAYTVKQKDKYLINSECELEFNSEASVTPVTVQDDEFVFVAFNDELMEYIGYPTCGSILATIENLEKDLNDWRALNHLFAHPTPHFKCETQDDANAISTMIKSNGWKVGTAIATNSDFLLKGTTGVEANLLMLSITTNAKIISGNTGIAVHFLGFANVMNNKATAEDMGEPTEVVLHSELTSWNAFYTELFNKAIRMRNSKLNLELPENLFKPKIVPLTDKQWALIRDIYLPLNAKGLVSNMTVLEQLPSIDAEVEEARIAEEAAKANETLVGAGAGAGVGVKKVVDDEKDSKSIDHDEIRLGNAAKKTKQLEQV